MLQTKSTTSFILINKEMAYEIDIVHDIVREINSGGLYRSVTSPAIADLIILLFLKMTALIWKVQNNG
jgi:hypothetical protein